MTDKGQSIEMAGAFAGSLKAADSMPTALAGRLLTHDAKVESKRRLMEARTHLFRSERDMIAEAGSYSREVDQQALAIQERAGQLLIEARSIEAEAAGRAEVMLKQAELERRLADRIREIAEANALAILDKVRDASESMMGWAEDVAGDLGAMMKQEAAGEVARKMGDINAVRDAMDDETRAGELLDLAAEMRKNAA